MGKRCGRVVKEQARKGVQWGVMGVVEGSPIQSCSKTGSKNANCSVCRQLIKNQESSSEILINQ